MRRPERRRSYEELYNDNQQITRMMEDTTRLMQEQRDDAQGIYDTARRIHEDAVQTIAARNHLLAGFDHLGELHARVLYEGQFWCRECRYEWPCNTQMIIQEIRRSMPPQLR